MAVEELTAQGLADDEAKRLSVRRLGNVTRARELSRGVWLPAWLEGLAQDARYAVRVLAKTPIFTITALITLTLTVGVTTNYFALFNGLFLKPWDVPDTQRVVVVDAMRRFSTQPEAGFPGLFLATYTYLHDHARTVNLAAFDNDRVDRLASATDQSIRYVSGSYFQVLGFPMAAGRPLLADDDEPARPKAVAVISYAVWQNEFGGAAVLGQPLKINNVTFEIVGVAARGVTDSRPEARPAAWLPIAARPLLVPSNSLTTDFASVPFVAGRLIGEATRLSAESELRALVARLPVVPIRNGVATTDLTLTGTALIEQSRAQWILDPMALFSIVPVLVLLLGCANVGNLQLARGFSRRRELATRTALGASRVRVVRQLLIESLVLTIGAGALSLAMAYVVPRMAMLWFEPGLGQSSFDLAPDARVYAFSAGLALVTCVLSGLLPALRNTRMGMAPHYVGVERARLRSVLLVIQTGASVTLLIGVSLLARGVQYAAGQGLGFEADHVATMELRFPPGYDAARRRRFTADLLDDAKTAGLQGFAVGTMPYTANYSRDVQVPGGPKIDATQHFVSPGYFDLFRIPLRSGRVFDRDQRLREAVINQTMAKALFPGQNPLGHSFRYVSDAGANTDERRVVGVVADARTEALNHANAGIYEMVGTANTVAIQDEHAARERLSTLISQLDPRIQLEPFSVPGRVWDELHASVVTTVTAASMAVLALIIATVGTFGVLSYAVGERTGEIGVRRALGARARDLVWLLLGRLCRPLGAGLLLGLVSAQPLTALLRHYLFGLSVHDPLAYVVVIVTVVLAGTAALIGPIVRAIHVDPAITLRHE
jgi:predicted permease